MKRGVGDNERCGGSSTAEMSQHASGPLMSSSWRLKLINSRRAAELHQDQAEPSRLLAQQTVKPQFRIFHTSQNPVFYVHKVALVRSYQTAGPAPPAAPRSAREHLEVRSDPTPAENTP